MLVADAEEPPKAQDGVGHSAADFVDHDTLDRSDLLIVRAIDGSTLDLITADE